MENAAVEADRGPIYDRIDAIYPTLPPRAQRVADTVLDHLGDIATYSVAELAQLSGTSAATVSRLFSSLGFQDFAEVKNHVRALRGGGVPLGAAPSPVDESERFRVELDNIRRVSEQLHGELLERMSEALCTAGTVLMVGMRSSYPVAMRLRESLAQVRPRVVLAPQPGQSLGEEFAHVGEGDVVMVVGFRRRVSAFGDIMRLLPTTGATIILIADSTARRYAQYADMWVDCPIDGVGAFDSYAAAMSAATQITDAALEYLGSKGKRSVMRIAQSFEALGEIDDGDLR
ncbi:MurR/RpiR family transcriptional regulator [Sinomonas sp. ASV322]|uniref:MurR/RpiR family transcriptional regulator n=1 Tax=Sinomonas sp. ASV322 TaxID=3041920 RepID=UPI0027DC7856|nr:MurR/RpiR family transcriptional regulator [Sinomonas sp. ASV322]MDQ4504293.1 MurR/RpiR family transcriptional regulator [Sinomonas sp. ASV322]